jgi:hypothetical protein
MRLALASVILWLSTTGADSSRNSDRFNYRDTDGRDFGPEEWRSVQCEDVGQCLGWPDGWDLGIGWELERNKCEWCPATGNDCGNHRQSPINLERSPSSAGHDPECYDYHWMVRSFDAEQNKRLDNALIFMLLLLYCRHIRMVRVNGTMLLRTATLKTRAALRLNDTLFKSYNPLMRMVNCSAVDRQGAHFLGWIILRASLTGGTFLIPK